MVKSNNFKDGVDKIGALTPISFLPSPLPLLPPELLISLLLSLLDKRVLMKRDSEQGMEPEKMTEDCWGLKIKQAVK